MEQDEPTDAEVVSALGRTGFILEHRVAQVLRDHDFRTYMNYAFPDGEKSREIDVVALRQERAAKGRAKVALECDVIIECKSGRNPLVILGETGKEAFLHLDGVRADFDPLDMDFPRSPHQTIWQALDLEHLPGMIAENEFVGRQLIRMTRARKDWEADNNSVYDSILYPLAKATTYRLELTAFDEDSARRGKYSRWEEPGIQLTFSVIVTSGPVYAVEVTPEATVVNRTGWASLRRSFSIDDLIDELFVEVVSFDHFSNYLENRLIRALLHAKEVVTTNIDLFDPVWLKENYGSPKKIQDFNAWLKHFTS